MRPYILFGLLAACTTPAVTGPCDDANARLGVLACVHSVPDDVMWWVVSGSSTTGDVTRLASYMTPATDAAPLPTLYVNQNLFPLHYDLLTQAFPDLYAGLTWDQYGELVAGPDRTYLAGDLSAHRDDDGSVWYGFVVWERAAEADTTVTLAQVTAAYDAITETFGVAPVSWVPYTENQEAAAQSWGETPFPIREVDDDVDYEVYTQGTGYGTVRGYTLADLDQATADAAYGYQDLLVLDEAPLDLERVVAGVVTGSRQGALSHINVRSAARGTPNCYVADPLTKLADWEGLLVRFTCGEDAFSLDLTTEAEAQAWWDSIRPDPVDVPTPDLSWTALTPLLELPTDTAAERDLNLSRYGAKGSNLGTLYQRIPAEYQLDGFVIPFWYYDRFVREATWTVDLGAGEVEASFQETLDAWLSDPAFLTDAAVRRERLDALREGMEDATVPADLVEAIDAEVLATWGRDDVMVRFRSSSNAEDALEFSGAGLYESESGCLADALDGDDEGPSICDPDKDKEQTIARALKQVWASLWNMAAYEERDWYGVDQSAVAMGVLADTRIDDEQANAVAFTGNPTALDDRMMIQAQVGAYDVVSAEAGITPETILVTVEDGEVTKILRVDTSSELESGEWVLDDAQVTELSELLWQIDQDFPVDDVAPDGGTILLDTEWKVDASGQLLIKQVRTFLRDDDSMAGG